MNLTADQVLRFKDVVRPVIAYLNDNCNPHCTAVIDQTGAELSEAVLYIRTMEFVKGDRREGA